jgi:hypothetical protein
MTFRAKLDRYIWNNLIAFDQVMNTIYGGDPDETISSRIGKVAVTRPDSCKFCVFVCYLLDKIDPDHCTKSVEKDRGKREVIK